MYQGAQKELTAVGSEAQRGFTGLTNAVISRTRGLSLAGGAEAGADGQQQQQGESSTGDKTKELTTDEAIKESENVLSRLRSEAAKRLKDIQRAEDAADEALLRFGTNISAFLRDAVSIAPPSGGDANNNNNAGGDSTVLFESKDAAGKRVIHTSRFDAQLHVIHTSTESFTKDPATGDWETWGAEFDIKGKTEDISRDLEKYPELRSTMEKLVPETIPYEDFWKRYYFLRHGIDLAEARRKELLKGECWIPFLNFSITTTWFFINYANNSASSRVCRGGSRLGRGLGRRGRRPEQGRRAQEARVHGVLHDHPPSHHQARREAVHPPEAERVPQVQRREVAARQRDELRHGRCRVRRPEQRAQQPAGRPQG